MKVLTESLIRVSDNKDINSAPRTSLEHQITVNTLLDELRGKKLLLAASTGGHLAQLNYLARLIQPSPDSLWVTFDKPQSRSLDDGRRLTFIDYIAPRDFKRVLSGRREFSRILAEEEFDAAISTGSAIALSALPAAWSAKTRAIYIESVSRYEGPSLSGRLVSYIPGITLRTQHEEWADGKWPFEFSVMDTWQATEKSGPAEPIKRVFVTLGTIEPYRFDSVVDAVVAALPPDADVVWQLGATKRDDLPGTVHDEIPSAEFNRLARESDVVVTHAGVGSIMSFLNMDCNLVAVPRRKKRNEHVDDHQLQVASDLARRGLCVVAEADELTLADLERSREISVVAA